MLLHTRPFSAFSASFLAALLLSLAFLWLLLPLPRLRPSPQIAQDALLSPIKEKLRVYVAELPRDLNYGLVEQYWAYEGSKNAIGVVSEASLPNGELPPYPEDPLVKQYSAEYWLLGDLMTPEYLRTRSVAKRVWNSSEADVVFVPFFATLSAELQLRKAKGKFRRKIDNEDYERQKRVLDIVMKSVEWQRSGGSDHVFVLTDPVAMWHFRSKVSPAILLVVDFGGWYMEDSKEDLEAVGAGGTIQHMQVSLLKDVIVPYTHLLPSIPPSHDHLREILLYFKGAKHRHRMGLIREKLWAVLENEPDVLLEEGFPNKSGQNQALKGMRSSEFCLHPAGDTPTSCRLFDAVASLCIPVIVSDTIELPFEGMIDYTEFSVIVSANEALQPNWLVQYLRSIDVNQRKMMRERLAHVQHKFEYDNGLPGGVGPMIEDGAVNLIWTKILHKVPVIKESVTRERRKPKGTSIPVRCKCS
eukprot:c18474_g1_i1 orf=162-1577(-)